MISSSLVRSVPPWNSMTSSPLERSVTSLAIASNATAEDSGGGVTCAKTSFFGWAWANAGALPSAMTPAAPAACNTRRRVVACCERDLVIGILPIDRSLQLACQDYSSGAGRGNQGTNVQHNTSADARLGGVVLVIRKPPTLLFRTISIIST